MRTLTRPWLALLVALLLSACGAFSRHIERGDELMTLGQYEAALQQYEAALALEPDDDDARRKAADAKAKIAQVYTADARDKLRAGDLFGAIRAAGEAQRKMPELDAVRAIVREISTAGQQQAEALLEQGKFAQGVDLYGAIYTELTTERAAVDGKLRQAKSRWADTLRTRAVAAEQAGQLAVALLHYAKIAQLLVDSPDTAKRDALYTALRDQHTYTVRLERGQDAGSALIGTRLQSSAQGRALRVASGSRAAGAQATLKLSVERPAFRTTRSTRSASARYQSGTKQVPNPDYRRQQDTVEYEERQLLRRQEEISRYESDLARYQATVANEGDTPGVSTGAEQGVSRTQSQLETARNGLNRQRRKVLDAKERLADIPQLRDEPVYSTHTYTVTTHTLAGSAALDVRITHADGRAPLTVKTAVATRASDDEHPAQPIARVAADPLVLPSRDTLSADLYARGHSLTEKALLESFEGWRKAQLAAGDAAESEQDKLAAYIVYVVADTGHVDPRIAAQLSAMSGIPDPIAVLAAIEGSAEPQ